MDERIWLKHKETGGFFHCPVGAVEAFATGGWEPTDERPPEPNAAIAERIDPTQVQAFRDGLVQAEALRKRIEERELAAKSAAETKEETKPRKRAAKPEQTGETSDAPSQDGTTEVTDGD
jgi:hypothetical protein